MSNVSFNLLCISIVLAAGLLAAAQIWISTNSSVGRYQVLRANDNNVLVIDTASGRLWQKFINSSGGPSVWTEHSTPWTTTEVR